MDNVLVIIIVAAAVLYLFFKFRKALKGGGCSGGCSGCSMSHKCPSLEKEEKNNK